MDPRNTEAAGTGSLAYPEHRLAPLNRLERAGWASIAADVFSLRSGEATILRDLVLSPGRIISNDALRQCFRAYEHKRLVRPVTERICVSVGRIRSALEDMGLPRSAIRNERETGYVIPAHYARRIRQIVEES